MIAESLMSIGWHWRIDQDFKILDQLILNGFSFNVIQKTNNVYVSQMYSRLEHLNNWGFNLNNVNYTSILSIMNSLNIKLKNSNFNEIIENLIGIGISLNDNDWKNKLNTLINLKFDFNSPNWKIELSNLRLMGIDFYDDWYEKHQKIDRLRQVGLNYRNILINNKINILTEMGVDFSEPEDIWMEKLDGLIPLNLISITNDVKKEKLDYLNDRNENILRIENKIIKFKKLNENPIYYIELEIKKLNNSLETEDNCENYDLIVENIKKLETQRINLLALSINYDEEIDKLKNEKSLLPNKSFLLNKNISIISIDKLEAFKSSGFNFYDKDYLNILSSLALAGLNFAAINWQDKLMELKELIPMNAIIEYGLSIINSIKALIMMPVQLLMKIVTKLIELIEQVIGIPLNPTEIIEWSKDIFIKFQKLIELILSLSTIEGITDLLFFSEDGFMLIDVYVPGFAELVSYIKKQMKIIPPKIIELKDKLTSKYNELDELKSKLAALTLLLAFQPKETQQKIDIKRKSLEDKSDPKSCEELAKLDELENKVNSYDPDKIKFDIAQISIEPVLKEITVTLKEITDLTDKLNIFDGPFCSWGENIDDLINTVKKSADLGDMTEVTKHLPVIINIICCTPKAMVNLIIGILNAVGHMDNLPDLWKLDLI